MEIGRKSQSKFGKRRYYQGRPHNHVLAFSFDFMPFRDSIVPALLPMRREEFKRLEGTAWISDGIVDFALRLVCA